MGAVWFVPAQVWTMLPRKKKPGELGASDNDGRRLAGVTGVQSPTAKPEQVHSRKNTAGRVTE